MCQFFLQNYNEGKRENRSQQSDIIKKRKNQKEEFSNLRIMINIEILMLNK